MNGMNPDSNINVMAVFPDGVAVIYGPADEETGLRRQLRSQQFPNYGAAVLAAAEYEANQREDRTRRAK